MRAGARSASGPALRDRGRQDRAPRGPAQGVPRARPTSVAAPRPGARPRGPHRGPPPARAARDRGRSAVRAGRSPTGVFVEQSVAQRHPTPDGLAGADEGWSSATSAGSHGGSTATRCAKRSGELGGVLECRPRAHRKAADPGRAACARGAERGPPPRAPARPPRRDPKADRRDRSRARRAPGSSGSRGARLRRPTRRDLGPSPRPRRPRTRARRSRRSGPAGAGRACRITSRGSTDPFQRLTSSRTAASTGSSGAAGRRLPAPNCTHRERAPPACSVNAT